MKTKTTIKKTMLLCLWALVPASLHAQAFAPGGAPGSVQTNTFWSDWFVQVDLDMSLQNPYGYDFSQVFPNGKTFGVDVALGKWFLPQVGVRGKFNWENGIGLFRNDHANWLAPFDHPGENMDRGGYIALYGDLLINLHSLFGAYRQDRMWNLSVYPRAGVNYNFGVSKGALLLGAGVLNTFRLNERWSLYLDAAYHMTGSGFVGDTSAGGTGTGSNSNGYFSLGAGAQLNLGQSRTGRHSVVTNRFWEDWFVQAALDMSLMNPYGCNFSEVFPKGKTYGVNVAAGKWLTPEFGLRGRINWENGLAENHHLEWVPPSSQPERNHDGGGFAVLTLEPMLNLTNLLAGYAEDKKWHTTAFVRAGLIRQFEIGSGSPLLGAGVGQSYQLNRRVGLFAELGYQVTTSESSGGRGTGMEVATGSNGFFDLDLGVVVSLGKGGWRHRQE